MVYAINWLNVGAIFYLMSSDLGAGVSGLGTLTAAFYLGIGVMQIPGGLLAAKWGPKRVVVIGIFLSSISALGTSVLSTVSEIALLRVLVGAGMALVFAPGVVLVARLLRGGKSGIGVGLFNSAFDFGGLFGIFGWIVVAGAAGWRPSLALSGGLGVLSGILSLLFVPNDDGRALLSVSGRALSTILKDKQLVLLGIGTLGFGLGNTIISSFMVTYLVKSLGVAGNVAGIVTSLLIAVPIFTAIWGGRIYDSLSRHRTLMILSLIGSAAALSFASYPSLFAAVVCSALGGVVFGTGYTLAFAGARDLNPLGGEYDSLAIAWVNSISLTGSFLPPIFFSYVVESLGYSQAWLWSGAVTLVFLVPIFLMVEHWSR